MHDSFARLVQASGGLSPADLARKLNESPQTVNNWSKRGLSKAGALNAERILGVSSVWLLTGEGSQQVSKLKLLDVEAFKQKHNIIDGENAVRFVEEKPIERKGFFKRWVPVKAYSKMGNDGYFMDMYGEGNGGDGYIPTHSGGKNAYGIKGTGDSMFPAIRNGWYVVCDPDAPPTPTEFVQVCLKDGRCTIKEFIGINNNVLSLIAVNGGERLTFNMDEVISIAAITDIIPPSQHRQDHPDAQ